MSVNQVQQELMMQMVLGKLFIGTSNRGAATEEKLTIPKHHPSYWCMGDQYPALATVPVEPTSLKASHRVIIPFPPHPSTQIQPKACHFALP